MPSKLQRAVLTFNVCAIIGLGFVFGLSKLLLLGPILVWVRCS